MSTAVQPKSKLYSTVEANLPNTRIVVIDRKYWSETLGFDYIQQLAFKQDVEAIKVSVEGKFYATCCMAAVCWNDFLSSCCRLNNILGAQVHGITTFLLLFISFTSNQI